jgi:hypothetical protein
MAQTRLALVGGHHHHLGTFWPGQQLEQGQHGGRRTPWPRGTRT